MIALLLSALAAGSAHAAEGISAYSFYPTAVEGSAREVGIGGAAVASPKDYSAVFINPAGLGGLSGEGIDFGSDSNSIDNFVVDTADPKARALNDPLKFSFFGFRYATANGWGFGFAAQNPYELDDAFSGTTKVGAGRRQKIGQDFTEIKAQSNIYTFAAARSYLEKRLSAGVAVNYIQVSESYDFVPGLPGSAVHVRSTNDAISLDAGLLGSPWRWLDVAAVYKMGWRVPFDSARNAQALGSNGARVQAFRDAKTPDRGSFGLRWHPNRYLNLLAQTNVVLPMRGTVVVGSGLFPGGTNVLTVGQSATIDGHWGVEVIPIDEPDLTFKLWGGGYLEDTGLQGGFRRYHRTAGFSLSPWALNLSMAIDDTNLYDNFTVGLGVDLLETATRVSKRFGWNLPL